MTLETWAYRDPEKVLMRKQAIEAAKLKQCGDCIHHRELKLFYETVHSCGAHMTYGHQCTKYEPKGSK